MKDCIGNSSNSSHALSGRRRGSCCCRARGLMLLGSFSKKREPQYRPQNTIVLIVGTPQKSTPNFGKAPLLPRLESAWSYRFFSVEGVKMNHDAVILGLNIGILEKKMEFTGFTGAI